MGINIHKKLLRWIIIIILVTILLVFLIAFFIAKQEKAAELAQQKEVFSKILDSVTATPLPISVNFEKQIAVGSPLVFGGAHSPATSQDDAWNKIQEVGVSMIRQDIFIEKELPEKITLEDYKNNKNNVQDPSNWNISNIKDKNKQYIMARERDMKSMAILAYMPKWLAVSGTDYGIPKDWNVYKDIVKKSYRLHRDNIDYLEIWNEPSFDFFLNVKDTGLSREDAYKKIFITAASAIREVDSEINDGKIIPIGGPVSHTPNELSMLETLVKDEEARKYLNFISYHNYEHQPEPSDVRYKEILNKYGLGDLPIFITEWNYNPQWDHPNPFNTSNLAITYTASKFVSFLNMGLAGANYFVLESLNMNRPNEGEGYYGFYRWKNSKAELLPQAKTWRLFTKSMKLGNGTSKIVEVNKPDDLNVVSFVNSTDNNGIITVNEDDEYKVVEFTLNNTNILKRGKVEVYIASKDSNGGELINSFYAYPKDRKLIFRYGIPKESVVGIIIQPENFWYDVFDPILPNK